MTRNSLPVTFPTVVVIRDNMTDSTLHNVQVTPTIEDGHKHYCLDVSDLAEGSMPKVVIFVPAAGLTAEAFTRIGLQTNQEGELLAADYYRLDDNGYAHILTLFND